MFLVGVSVCFGSAELLCSGVVWCGLVSCQCDRWSKKNPQSEMETHEISRSRADKRAIR